MGKRTKKPRDKIYKTANGGTVILGANGDFTYTPNERSKNLSVFDIPEGEGFTVKCDAKGHFSIKRTREGRTAGEKPRRVKSRRA